MKNVSIIGIGKWGKNYIKNLTQIKDVNIKYLSSLNKETFNNLEESLKIGIWTNDYKDAITNEVDTVIIATHPDSHFEISKYALDHGKNVICEKPCMFNNAEYEEIYNLIAKNNNIFYTNYINLFNPILDQVKQAVKDNFNHFTITNAGKGPYRDNYSALWDYGSHVISVLFYIFNPEDLKLHGFHIDQNNNYSLQLSYNSNRVYANFGNNYKERVNNFNLLTNTAQINWQDPRDGKPLRTMLEKYSKGEISSNLNLSFRISSLLKSLRDVNNESK